MKRQLLVNDIKRISYPECINMYKTFIKVGWVTATSTCRILNFIYGKDIEDIMDDLQNF